MENIHSFGNWVDICSLVVAMIYGVARARVLKQKFISKATGLTIANGIGLFPMALVVLSTFWTPALDAVLQTNKVILSIAGIVALLSILEDFKKRSELSTSSEDDGPIPMVGQRR